RSGFGVHCLVLRNRSVIRDTVCPWFRATVKGIDACPDGLPSPDQPGLGYPLRCEISAAAARPCLATSGMVSSLSRNGGPDTVTPATTWPPRDRMGAATDASPVSCSSTVQA